jgi:hypothetical protein
VLTQSTAVDCLLTIQWLNILPPGTTARNALLLELAVPVPGEQSYPTSEDACDGRVII